MTSRDAAIGFPLFSAAAIAAGLEGLSVLAGCGVTSGEGVEVGIGGLVFAAGVAEKLAVDTPAGSVYMAEPVYRVKGGSVSITGGSVDGARAMLIKGCGV